MFLDVAIGIFVAIWVSGQFSFPLSFGFLFWAIFIALLPDIDLAVEEAYFKLRGKKLQKHDHRDIFHYPIIYLLVGATVLLLLVSEVWALTFVVISLFHFLHDSIGIGWGVYWLYPFSDKRYSFFYQYDIFKHKIKPYKWVYSWSEEELKKMIAAYGDPDWIRTIYFRMHPYALVEILFFIFSVLTLYKVWF